MAPQQRLDRDGLTKWQRDALDALQAHGRAMRRAEAPSAGHPTDPDHAALDDRVHAHMAAHPGESYPAALDALLAAEPAVGEPELQPVRVDQASARLNDRVLAFAAANQLPYADALDRVTASLDRGW
jgi:hypothetical protein